MSETVEAAKAPGVFSLDKFLVDIAYPVEEVTVYTDAYSVNEKLKLSAEATRIDDKIALIRRQDQEEAVAAAGGQRTISEPVEVVDTVPADLVAKQLEIVGKLEALESAIEKSKLTLRLRGMAPHKVEELTKKHFEDDKKDYTGTTQETDRDFELIAQSIYQVTDSDDLVVMTTVTASDIEKLQGSLLAGEYYKIVTAVAHVNLNGALFEQATDAPFPSRRSNVAGK